MNFRLNNLQIELGAWPVPPIFQFLSQVGPVDVDEMLKVFNWLEIRTFSAKYLILVELVLH